MVIGGLRMGFRNKSSRFTTYSEYSDENCIIINLFGSVDMNLHLISIIRWRYEILGVFGRIS